MTCCEEYYWLLTSWSRL